MPRRRSHRGKPKYENGFILIKWELYDTQVWREMKWYSKLAYLRIKRKFHPEKSKEITVSYREMEDEMTKPTFAKAIRELADNEFIRIEQKGGLYRRRNYYSLSEGWRLKEDHIDGKYLHKGKIYLPQDTSKNALTSKRGLPHKEKIAY